MLNNKVKLNYQLNSSIQLNSINTNPKIYTHLLSIRNYDTYKTYNKHPVCIQTETEYPNNQINIPLPKNHMFLLIFYISL
jgi:hypothetical protein